MRKLSLSTIFFMASTHLVLATPDNASDPTQDDIQRIAQKLENDYSSKFYFSGQDIHEDSIKAPVYKFKSESQDAPIAFQPLHSPTQDTLIRENDKYQLHFCSFMNFQTRGVQWRYWITKANNMKNPTKLIIEHDTPNHVHALKRVHPQDCYKMVQSTALISNIVDNSEDAKQTYNGYLLLTDYLKSAEESPLPQVKKFFFSFGEKSILEYFKANRNFNGYNHIIRHGISHKPFFMVESKGRPKVEEFDSDL